jgi:hypothetical protein
LKFQNRINLIALFRTKTFFLKLARLPESRYFHSWVVGVGSPEEMKKFGFSITFRGKSTKEKNTYEDSVVSIDMPTREIIDKKVGLVMTVEFMMRIWGGNRVIYELNIFEEN